jgi:hypothetical protein
MSKWDKWEFVHDNACEENGFAVDFIDGTMSSGIGHLHGLPVSWDGDTITVHGTDGFYRAGDGAAWEVAKHRGTRTLRWRRCRHDE